MRAVVFEGVGTVAVRDVPPPILEDPHDAIVRVSLAGICGSDLHSYHGKLSMDPGATLGHEAVGVVQEVGDAITSFAPGDRVVAAFGIACGSCWWCRRGQTALCERFRMLGLGSGTARLPGAQAELVRIPFAETNLLAVPETVEDERALFVGDALTTGYQGAALADVGPADVVAVVGAGPVGFFCAQAAALRGARQVLLLDRDARRLAPAEHIEAVPLLVEGGGVRDAVRELTDGRGADVAIDAVGSVSAFETAVRVVGRGGRIAVVGVYGPEVVERFPIGAYWRRGLHLLFSGVCPVHAWWHETMLAVERGDIDPLPIVSHRLALDDAPRGYELFDRHEATKVVLRP